METRPNLGSGYRVILRYFLPFRIPTILVKTSSLKNYVKPPQFFTTFLKNKVSDTRLDSTFFEKKRKIMKRAFEISRF